MIVTLKLTGTNWRKVLFQFGILDRFMGPQHIHMRTIKRLAGLRHGRLFARPRASPMGATIDIVAVAETELQARDARFLIMRRVKRIKKALKNFLIVNEYSFKSLVLQFSVHEEPLDDRERVVHHIQSSMIPEMRPWFSDPFEQGTEMDSDHSLLTRTE